MTHPTQAPNADDSTESEREAEADSGPFRDAIAAITTRYRTTIDLFEQAKLLREHAERLDAQATIDEHERPFEDFVASNPYEAMEPFDESQAMAHPEPEIDPEADDTRPEGDA